MITILFTGNYDPTYNRTLILCKGLEMFDEVKIIHFPFKKLDSTSLVDLQKLLERVDVVYLPSFTHAEVRKIRRLTRLPIVFDPLISKYLTKVYDYKQVLPFSPRALKNYLKDRMAMNSADIVLADTIENKLYYHHKFKIPLEKLRLLPIGTVVDKELTPSFRNTSVINIGFYGGFIPLQGVEVIIDAANLLKDRKDLCFTLIGNGFEYERLHKKAINLNLENLHFKGWLDYEALMASINSFDICLGIFGDTKKAKMVVPNKIYHYASFAKPIISMDSMAIREVFSPGISIELCNPNAASLVKTIEKLAADWQLRKELGINAHALMSEKYAEKQIAAMFLDIICEIKQ